MYMYVYVCKHMYMYEYAIICMSMPAHTSYASLFQCFWAGFKLMRALNLEVGWWWAWFLSSTRRKLSELGGQRMGQRALPAGWFASHTKCALIEIISVQLLSNKNQIVVEKHCSGWKQAPGSLQLTVLHQHLGHDLACRLPGSRASW